MIGDDEIQTGSIGPRPARKRRGRPPKVKDQSGLCFDEADFGVELETIDRDDFLDGRRLGSLIGGE